jgi:hypothetical protein
MNRFVDKTQKNKWILKTGNVIYVSTLTKKRAHSKRAQVLIFDEEQDMEEEFYRAAMGIMVGAATSKIIHAGTTELNTLFEKNFLRLRAKAAVRETPITKATWTTLEKEVERAYDGQPQWVIDQELLTKWTVPEGRVFDNIEWCDWIETERFPLMYGIDINRTESICGLFVDQNEENCWIVEEFEWNFVKDQAPFDKLRGKDVEIEAGGYNHDEALVLQGLVGGTRVAWTKELKGERIIRLRKMRIHICEQQCPKIAADLRNAQYDRYGMVLKDFKHPNHFLDCCLHAIGARSAEVFGARAFDRAKNQTDRVEALKKIQKGRGVHFV